MSNFIELTKFFFKTSRSYISPKGFIGNVRYYAELPIAYIRFMYYSRNDHKCNYVDE